MIYKLCYDNIPVLAQGFTRGTDAIARSIQEVRGIEDDASQPNHAFIVVEFWGQKFAAEQTFGGYRLNSLEKYTSDKNRIVALYYYAGWDVEEKRSAALKRISYLLRKQGDKTTKEGKYDKLGLGWFLSFDEIPIIGKLFMPDPIKTWCSENDACIHRNQGGATWLEDTRLAPDEYLSIVKSNDECKAVLGYYL